MAQKVADDRYYELGDDTIEELGSLIKNVIYTPMAINYTFQGDRNLKSLIKVSKITDRYAFKLESPILVEVNELLWDEMCNDTDAVEILVREACSKIEINSETGKISTSNKNVFLSSKGVLV